MLLKIYNWFTEGFDTAALKEAKATLAELGHSDLQSRVSCWIRGFAVAAVSNSSG